MAESARLEIVFADEGPVSGPARPDSAPGGGDAGVRQGAHLTDTPDPIAATAKLAELVADCGLSELAFEAPAFKVTLRRAPTAGPATPAEARPARPRTRRRRDVAVRAPVSAGG